MIELEQKAKAWAAIGVQPKEASVRDEPGRVREAFKAGHHSRDDEVEELKDQIKMLTEMVEKAGLT